MKVKQIINRILLVFSLIFLFLFFHKKEQIIINKTDISQIEHLDIVVTSGQSVQSKLLSLFNFSVESYSHVGIICKGKNKIYVLHSTTDGTKENSIRYDKLQTFIDLSNVNFYKILRSKNIKKHLLAINREIEKYKRRKIPFDNNFDNNNEDKIYCSELVYNIYHKNGIITSEINLTQPIHPKKFTEIKEFETITERKSTANNQYKQ